ncbi:MAG: hypothetical protein HQK52_00920 [Oligoflexia bacterium]|nr:hypothetical protein [Oligoflexia bacterium]
MNYECALDSNIASIREDLQAMSDSLLSTFSIFDISEDNAAFDCGKCGKCGKACCDYSGGR